MKNIKTIINLKYFIGCVLLSSQLFSNVATADYLVYQVNNVQQYDIYEKPSAVHQQAVDNYRHVAYQEAAYQSRYQPAPEQTNRPQDIGKASYYGIQYHGRPTASGETYDMYAMTAAHPNLPFGTAIRVTNLENGQSVIVRVNDRGPLKPGRIVDVSQAAAERLGLILNGTADVQVEIVG
jgi:rare lipoprotein A